jgi:hypothetical protein
VSPRAWAVLRFRTRSNLGGLLNRQFSGFRSLQNPVDVIGGLAANLTPASPVRHQPPCRGKLVEPPIDGHRCTRAKSAIKRSDASLTAVGGTYSAFAPQRRAPAKDRRHFELTFRLCQREDDIGIMDRSGQVECASIHRTLEHPPRLRFHCPHDVNTDAEPGSSAGAGDRRITQRVWRGPFETSRDRIASLGNATPGARVFTRRREPGRIEACESTAAPSEHRAARALGQSRDQGIQPSSAHWAIALNLELAMEIARHRRCEI